MTLSQALILGIVQGLTEYLPVSSSAHLVLVPQIMHWNFNADVSFVFNVLVQLGTLVGVVAYFFTDLKKMVIKGIEGLIKKDPFSSDEVKLGLLIVLATIPAASIGLLFKSDIAGFFSNPHATLQFLLLTSIMLVITHVMQSARQSVRIRDALWIGFAQALALFPGVSRSGSTIAAGIYCGLSKETAARFSFLMSIPALFGASVIAAKDLVASKELVQELALPLVVGFISSAVVGYAVIAWFMHFLKKQSLLWFAGYCALVGIVGLWMMKF